MVRAARLVVAGVIIVGAIYGPTQMSRASPGRPEPPPQNEQRLVIRGDAYHQCYVPAWINGRRFVMLLDTGASSVSFGPHHLSTLGIPPSALVYDRRVSTANGIARAAGIQLRELRIGTFEVHDIAADVDEHGAPDPLLGASVLKLLHVEIADGTCTLSWRKGDRPMSPFPIPVQLAALGCMSVCAFVVWDFLQFLPELAALFALLAIGAGLIDLGFVVYAYLQKLRFLSPHERNLRHASQPIGVAAVVLAGALLLYGGRDIGRTLAALALHPVANWPFIVAVVILSTWGVTSLVTGVRRCRGMRDGMLAVRAFFKLTLGVAVTFWLWRQSPSWAAIATSTAVIAGLWCLVTGLVRFLLLIWPRSSARVIVETGIADQEFDWNE